VPKEILIVDDELSVVVPSQFLMEQQGYRVMVAARGRGVEIANSQIIKLRHYC